MTPTPSKLQLPTLTLKNNYFVVQEGQEYHYYPIKAADQDTPGVIRLAARPPVIREGVAIVGRAAYMVSVADLVRGIVRKSSKVTQGRADDSTTTKPGRGTRSSASAPSSGPSDAPDTDEPGALSEDLLEVTQAANATWEEQTRALLETLYQEEGLDWEIANPA